MVAAIICLAIAVLVAVEAWLIRKGVIKKWPRRYYAATNAPLHVRKGCFGLLPFAGVFLLLGGGIIVGSLGRVGGFIALLMLPAVVACFFLAFRWMRKTPEFVKPEWLKRAERGEEDLDHLAAVEGGRRLVAVPPWQYWATLGFAVVVVVLVVVFHLPVALLAGLGFPLSALAVGRPRRERPPTRRADERGPRSGR